MKTSFLPQVLLGALIVLIGAGSAWATDVTPLPATANQETVAPAGLDETTLELFVAAVADMHSTAKNLARRLDTLEYRLQAMRQRTAELEKENDSLRKVVKLQKAKNAEWHSWPLDKEVDDANKLLESLVARLAGMTPIEN